ncbi:ATPase [Thermovenabulum gondwanense]|uniref:Chromosome partition protein Smc n=1 Tax=Thermovenabulum gondwanense TaxID=520767 RepID=A0A162MFJ4_9FIRM|nr:ATPase [Thermovenabulum gondwanense]KYO65742.1 hypothetical protein ATZ99_13800 [Thermovenabulum gondwanense]
MELEKEIEILEQNYQKLFLDYTVKKNIKEQLENEKNKTLKEYNEIKEREDILQQVRILLQKTAEFSREQVKQQIEILVTNCLQYVFGSNIEFKISIEEARNRPEAEFFVISNYNGQKIITKPQDARGGGVVDVISLALRIAVLENIFSYKKGPIILDEPAKHVSSEYIQNVAMFLKHISEAFNRQIIMVTHNTFLSEIADVAYKVELKEGKSVVTKIRNED